MPGRDGTGPFGTGGCLTGAGYGGRRMGRRSGCGRGAGAGFGAGYGAGRGYYAGSSEDFLKERESWFAARLDNVRRQLETLQDHSRD